MRNSFSSLSDILNIDYYVGLPYKIIIILKVNFVIFHVLNDIGSSIQNICTSRRHNNYLAEVCCRNRNSKAKFDVKSLIVDIVIGGIGVCIYIVFYLNYLVVNLSIK